MKTPVPPPSLEAVTASLRGTPRYLELLLAQRLRTDPDYHPWDWFLLPAAATRPRTLCALLPVHRAGLG